MEGLEAKAVELLDKLEKITVTLAPQALDVAEGCMKVSGLQEVVLGISTVAICLVIIYIANKSRKVRGRVDLDNPPVQEVIIVMALVIGCCALYTNVINAWAWIAVFNPKLAIANKLLGF